MTLRIIGNKRIELSNDEFDLFNKIAASYSKPNFDGKSLFNDLFETDEEGLIIYLKPPKKMFSMEVVLFLQNIMVHQHLRKIYAEHDRALAEVAKLKEEFKVLLSEMKESSGR